MRIRTVAPRTTRKPTEWVHWDAGLWIACADAVAVADEVVDLYVWWRWRWRLPVVAAAAIATDLRLAAFAETVADGKSNFSTSKSNTRNYELEDPARFDEHPSLRIARALDEAEQFVSQAACAGIITLTGDPCVFMGSLACRKIARIGAGC